ncbi:M-phase inducer phosphatase-like [Condylostylus longicornis]|uniref:M-phase inducer phosphatase-like n=1 Tax=Condylostylus longicornis TaxID=2530218 RepID=UPI00244E48C8|nr:M-phase inducer phosphatase-like [Condylostylus longicornis]
MLWQNIQEESMDIIECTSLISNNFTLNGNDETGGNINNNNNNNDDNYKSRNNISQRRLLHFSAIQNDKELFDDFTLYDEQTTISPTKFRKENLQFSPRNDDKFTSLDEYDGSSVDSGFGQFNSQITKFKFIEPKLPMKQQQQLNVEPSPRKYLINNNNNNTLNNNFNYNFNVQTSPTNFKIFHSLSSGSMESIDDEWSDLIEMESLDEEQTFPSNLTSLISGHIKTIRTTPESKYNENKNFNNNNSNNSRPNVRRCLSLNEYNINSRKGLFENDNNNNSTEYINSPLEQYNRTLTPKTPEILRTVQEQQLDLTPNSSNPSYIFHQHQMHVEKCFKRPEPPCFSPIQSKRYKTELKSQQANSYQQYDLQQSKSASIIEDKENHNISSKINIQEIGKCNRPIFRKSMSMNDADIMTALSRSSDEPELIGDFSKPFCLPLMEGKHRDLKSISSDTLAKLLHGHFKDTVANFKIIDCRYPYEYDGGHIKGASNLYTQEQILDELVNCKTEAPVVHSNGPKRNILVFHCEFSSERGPKLSRFLRNHDRWRNSNSYPALHYPEIYLLHGGYKEFYENFSELCDPISYRPMLEPSFGEQYRQFRAKSKSWNGDVKGSCAKNGLKKSRSRLLL